MCATDQNDAWQSSLPRPTSLSLSLDPPLPVLFKVDRFHEFLGSVRMQQERNRQQHRQKDNVGVPPENISNLRLVVMGRHRSSPSDLQRRLFVGDRNGHLFCTAVAAVNRRLLSPNYPVAPVLQPSAARFIRARIEQRPKESSNPPANEDNGNDQNG